MFFSWHGVMMRFYNILCYRKESGKPAWLTEFQLFDLLIITLTLRPQTLLCSCFSAGCALGVSAVKGSTVWGIHTSWLLTTYWLPAPYPPTSCSLGHNIFVGPQPSSLWRAVQFSFKACWRFQSLNIVWVICSWFCRSFQANQPTWFLVERQKSLHKCYLWWTRAVHVLLMFKLLLLSNYPRNPGANWEEPSQRDHVNFDCIIFIYADVLEPG